MVTPKDNRAPLLCANFTYLRGHPAENLSGATLFSIWVSTLHAVLCARTPDVWAERSFGAVTWFASTSTADQLGGAACLRPTTPFALLPFAMKAPAVAFGVRGVAHAEAIMLPGTQQTRWGAWGALASRDAWQRCARCRRDWRCWTQAVPIDGLRHPWGPPS